MLKVFNIYLLSMILAFAPLAQGQTVSNRIVQGTQFPGAKVFENYLKNTGFESNTKNNVTDASSIATLTSSTPVAGKYSLSIDATTSGQLVKILGNIIKQNGANCSADFYYRGDASLYKAYVMQSTTKVTPDTQLLNSNGGTQPVSLNFPCGDGSTATDVVIEATSASAAAVKFDDFYAGLATNIGSVAQAYNFGIIKQSGASSCFRTTGRLAMRLHMLLWAQLLADASL